MIPKKIHYCWFGGNELPLDAKKCIESWKKNMPDFEIIEWNENNFNVKENKYVEEAYNSKKYAFVSDYARLKILYDKGGIYFDVDVELIKPLTDDILSNGFLAQEDSEHINTGLGFACKRKDKIIKKMLDEYNDICFITNEEMDLTPCTIRNTNSIKEQIKTIGSVKMAGDLIIYPKDFFNPLDIKTGILTVTDDTISIHYGSASWLDDIDKNLLNYRQKVIKKHGIRIGKTIYIIRKFFVYLIHKPHELKKIIFK